MCKKPWQEEYDPDCARQVWEAHGSAFLGIVGMIKAGEPRSFLMIVQCIRRHTRQELIHSFFGPKWDIQPYMDHSAYKFRLALEDENEAFVEHARFMWGVVLSSPGMRRFSIWGGDLKWHQYQDAEDNYIRLKAIFFDEIRWDEDDEIRGFKLKREGTHGECDLTLEDYETTQEIDWSDVEDDTHPMD